jgi:RNA polymerase sigma-70 factor (ECF subfamily)
MPESQRERFSRLFLESRATLRRKLRRFVRSREDADDVVQEAFLRGYEGASGVRDPGAFVYSAARNLAVDSHRREESARKATRGAATLAAFEVNNSSEAKILSDERARLVREAIERMPRQRRMVFALKIFHDYSYREISETLQISVKTVENHIARALQDTHEYLRERYGEGDDRG